MYAVIHRAAQAVLVVALFLYAWSVRAQVKQLMKSIWFYKVRTPFSMDMVDQKEEALAVRAADDFLRWRLDMHCRLIRCLLPVTSLYAILATALMRESLPLVVVAFIYVSCLLIDRGTIPKSSRTFDLLFVFWCLVYIVRLIRNAVYYQSVVDTFFRVGTLRSSISVSYLSHRRVAIANIVISILEIIFSGFELGLLTTAWICEASSEIYQLSFTLILAYVVEEAGRSLVTQRLKSKTASDGWRAVRSILSVLCDTVVHVSCDFTILNDCPQLGHLLMSGVGSSHKLEGDSFLRHVVDEDMHRFKAFMSRQSELARVAASVTSEHLVDPPAALRVTLRGAMGSAFRVELIHAYLPGFDADGHLLGIRELGDYERTADFDGVGTQNGPNTSMQAMAEFDTTSVRTVDSDLPSVQTSHNDSPLGKIRSLSLLVDMNDPITMPVIEARARFRQLNDEERVVGEEYMLPCLSRLLSTSKWGPFQQWAQTVANALLYDDPLPSFGNVTLRPLESLLNISARRVYAEEVDDTEPTDLLRIHFENLDCRYSSATRNRSYVLPCIHETSRAAPSTIGARTASLFVEGSHSLPDTGRQSGNETISTSSQPHINL
eukprot:TRINITY_DN7983_c0_g1_i1.p1 TRINITY_DN7983_c0_g1~~TRINITY_DN7983_c0_g1_i1.p1  ORF type:complete len:605 (-),score=15.70 TRINITY_DN7983_c0_g1_i1:63-1877(-)